MAHWFSLRFVVKYEIETLQPPDTKVGPLKLFIIMKECFRFPSLRSLMNDFVFNVIFSVIFAIGN
jgi:hypothetical protein